jgi:broad specificity phosphatase PhoE
MFFFIRHAAQDDVAVRLAGRTPGSGLGEAGKAQARRLGERMRGERLDQIHASPRRRAVETAQAIETTCGAGPVEIADALDEIDFGAWSGLDFLDLAQDPQWRRWNEIRSLARPPGGESMLEAQMRIMDHLERLSAATPEGAVALVTHAEMIRAALLYCLGLSLDAWSRLEISPASITRLSVTALGATILGVNETMTPLGAEARA